MGYKKYGLIIIDVADTVRKLSENFHTLNLHKQPDSKRNK